MVCQRGSAHTLRLDRATAGRKPPPHLVHQTPTGFPDSRPHRPVPSAHEGNRGVLGSSEIDVADAVRRGRPAWDCRTGPSFASCASVT